MIYLLEWLNELCYDLADYPPFYVALSMFTISLMYFGHTYFGVW